MPNTNTPVINYPILTNKSLAQNPRRYPSGQAATDKYFQEQHYKNEAVIPENQENKYNYSQTAYHDYSRFVSQTEREQQLLSLIHI